MFSFAVNFPKKRETTVVEKMKIKIYFVKFFQNHLLGLGELRVQRNTVLPKSEKIVNWSNVITTGSKTRVVRVSEQKL